MAVVKAEHLVVVTRYHPGEHQPRAIKPDLISEQIT